jgi:hypothetical protein
MPSSTCVNWFFQRTSTAAVHDQENRPTHEQIQANYGIDPALRDIRR